MRAKYRRWRESHPRLYASRHLVAGVGQVLVAVLGITLAIHLLPPIHIALPAIDLPDIPWPSINLPDVSVPEWVREVMQTKPYWFPIALGIYFSLRELKRRRRTAD